jgi:hypothetical protein
MLAPTTIKCFSINVSAWVYLQNMNPKYCPGCFSSSGIRTILYGMPSEEPDPAIYVVGGCLIDEGAPEMECIECHWAGSKTDVAKAARTKRFIYTDEDLTGLIIYKKLRISHEALSVLQDSETWREGFGLIMSFTTEGVYGPEGKLSWLWQRSWDTESEMRGDLMQNMGGGVPIWVIDKLIEIVLRLSEKESKNPAITDPWANY